MKSLEIDGAKKPARGAQFNAAAPPLVRTRAERERGEGRRSRKEGEKGEAQASGEGGPEGEPGRRDGGRSPQRGR